MFAKGLLALTALTVAGLSVSIAEGNALTVGCGIEASLSKTASENTDPIASGSVGGTNCAVPTFRNGKEIIIGEGDFGTTIETAEGSITIQGSANTDPFVIFAISVIDFGGPTDFTVVIPIPIDPLVGPHSVSSSLGISITDGITGDGASIAPFAFPTIMVNDVGTCPASDVDIGTLVAVGSGATTTASFSAGPFAAPVGAGCDTTMTVTLSFSGSGFGDAYGITGRFDLSPIPAPTSLALFGAALVGLVGFTRRRSV